MAKKKNKHLERSLSIYRAWYTKGSLLELKKWVDEAIEAGCTKYTYELSWGYYDDIDDIELIVEGE